MFASARRALGVIFDPRLRGLVLASLGLTALLFALGLVAAEMLIAQLPVLGSPAVNRALELLAPVLFVFLLGALGAPVAAFFGTFFLDRLAASIEARDYPQDPPAPAGHWGPALKAGLRLTGLVLGADIVLLPIDIGLPGVGELLSLLVNGWLLGREYFELTALRHLSLAEADRMRRANGWSIGLAGMAVSLLSVVPVADLFAPLFGTALMVHLFKHLQRTGR